MGKAGAWLIVLIVVFVFGNIWFHLVESILGRIKRFFMGQEDSGAWHPLPSEQEEKQDDAQ